MPAHANRNEYDEPIAIGPEGSSGSTASGSDTPFAVGFVNVHTTELPSGASTVEGEAPEGRAKTSAGAGMARPMALPLESVNQRLPSPPVTIAYGPAFGPSGTGYSVM